VRKEIKNKKIPDANIYNRERIYKREDKRVKNLKNKQGFLT
jgi:hypothetical protein